MSRTKSIMQILIGLCLLAVIGLAQAETTVPPETDGTASATPFTQEEGQTGGIRSDAQIDAESGAEHYTQSRIRDGRVFQQNEGQWWRTVRNGPVTFYGGWLISLLPALILAFYAVFGPLKLHGTPSGRLMERFSNKERVIHWSTAVSFVLLALTGLAILFGKHVLIPLMGHDAFSWVAVISKNVHNVVGPFFAVCVAVMVAHFLRDNLFRKIDLEWFANAHLVLSGKRHIPSYKYNGAEKLWFWGGVTLLGIVVSASGLVMDFPTFEQSRQTMQIANLVHGISALLFIAAGMGHIYMGTLGANGAFAAMKTGMVDETWAKEHHELWFEEEKAKR